MPCAPIKSKEESAEKNNRSPVSRGDRIFKKEKTKNASYHWGPLCPQRIARIKKKRHKSLSGNYPLTCGQFRPTFSYTKVYCT